MANMVPTLAMSALQYRMDSAQQKASRDVEKTETAAQVQQLQYAQAIEDKERRGRLRRAVAAQRARFGAQGISSSGTANAVLGGLAAETDREISQQSAITQLRTNTITDDYARRKSLLEASSPQNRLSFGLMQKSLRNIPLIDF